MSKHTPGEWVAFYKHKYNEWHVSVPIEGSSMKLGLFPNGVPTSNPEGDAKLIAKATLMHELLSEAQHMLAHSRCKDDDATKCPACSLESRIDAVLAEPK